MSLITFSDRLSKFLMIAAAAWTFGLAFLVMGNIIGRTVFDSPIYGTAEIVAASIVIVVFLQAGYAIRSRSMLKADFLVIHLPEIVQRVLLAIGYLLGAAPTAAFIRVVINLYTATCAIVIVRQNYNRVVIAIDFKIKIVTYSIPAVITGVDT